MRSEINRESTNTISKLMINVIKSKIVIHDFLCFGCQRHLYLQIYKLQILLMCVCLLTRTVSRNTPTLTGSIQNRRNDKSTLFLVDSKMPIHVFAI